MGNILRRFTKGDKHGDDHNPYDLPTSRPQYGLQSCLEDWPKAASRPPNGGVMPATAGVTSPAQDLLNFESTSMVPEALGQNVTSPKKAQVKCSVGPGAGRTERSPRAPASKWPQIVQPMDISQYKRHDGKPEATHLRTPSFPSASASSDHPPSSLPEGVQFVLNTLPVHNNCIGDGDGFSAFVDTTDPSESTNVPLQVREMVNDWTQACTARDYQKTDALLRRLDEAGYKITSISGEEILARKYKIRMRGIDAPELEMPYGKESKNELVKLIGGKSVTVFVYGNDKFGRYVGDIYCDNVFIQERMLKGGHAWHFEYYDKRPEYAQWQRKARAAHRGLWASENPEKPWDWRRKQSAAAAKITTETGAPLRAAKKKTARGKQHRGVACRTVVPGSSARLADKEPSEHVMVANRASSLKSLTDDQARYSKPLWKQVKKCMMLTKKKKNPLNAIDLCNLAMAAGNIQATATAKISTEVGGPLGDAMKKTARGKQHRGVACHTHAPGSSARLANKEPSEHVMVANRASSLKSLRDDQAGYSKPPRKQVKKHWVLTKKTKNQLNAIDLRNLAMAAGNIHAAAATKITTEAGAPLGAAKKKTARGKQHRGVACHTVAPGSSARLADKEPSEHVMVANRASSLKFVRDDQAGYSKPLRNQVKKRWVLTKKKKNLLNAIDLRNLAMAAGNIQAATAAKVTTEVGAPLGAAKKETARGKQHRGVACRIAAPGSSAHLSDKELSEHVMVANRASSLKSLRDDQAGYSMPLRKPMKKLWVLTNKKKNTLNAIDLRNLAMAAGNIQAAAAAKINTEAGAPLRAAKKKTAHGKQYRGVACRTVAPGNSARLADKEPSEHVVVANRASSLKSLRDHHAGYSKPVPKQVKERGVLTKKKKKKNPLNAIDLRNLAMAAGLDAKARMANKQAHRPSNM